jgi:outer membrane protein assembly factor BamA
LAAGSAATNRVDYETVFLGIERGNPDNPHPHWRGHARLLIPFRDNTRGFLGFDLDLLIPLRGRTVGLQLQGFKKTVSNDIWQYPADENGCALLISHTDFLDYYERSGGRIGVVINPGHSLMIAGAAYLDHSQSLRTTSVSSLANNDRPLRSNPAIDRGEILGVDLTATYDTRDNPGRPSSAWFLQGTVDAGFKTGPGDFSFTTLMLDVRRYNRVWRRVNLDLRARIFTGWSDLPRQRLQSLNGYGGVRGMHDIPFPDARGDRLALFSTELRIPLPQIPVIKILYTRWDILFFGDIGVLRLDGGAAGPFRFLNSPKDAWGKTVGIGVSGEAFLPYLGFYVAQDVTRFNKRPRLIIRAQRSF